MRTYLIEVYEPCDDNPSEGCRWLDHHCDGTYDELYKLERAVGEAIADVCVQRVIVKNY